MIIIIVNYLKVFGIRTKCLFYFFNHEIKAFVGCLEVVIFFSSF